MHFITKHITKLFTRFTPFAQEKKVLGRWAIDYCDKKTNHKIDLSNEDHCGPCGQYILDKHETNTTPTTTTSVPSISQSSISQSSILPINQPKP